MMAKAHTYVPNLILSLESHVYGDIVVGCTGHHMDVVGGSEAGSEGVVLVPKGIHKATVEPAIAPAVFVA